MTSALEQLTAAALLLDHGEATLELAVRAMYEACPRGLAFGIMAGGPKSGRVLAMRAMHRGEFVLRAVPHLAHVRTPAFDVADVPEAQRNRWVEPFREGIATHAGFKSSTIYPITARFGVLEQGRVVVCAGARQVAMIGLAIPEGTEFADAERVSLRTTAESLVVPLRIASVVAEQARDPSALDRLLDGSTDALVATDARGVILGTSRGAVELLRADRVLADVLTRSVRGAARSPMRVTQGGRTIHVTPHAQGEVAYLVAIDAGGFAEVPVSLSERQHELCALVERGLTNAEIARAMSLAAPTVKTMLERLYKKAGVANRVELASWWRARADRGTGA